MKCFNNISISNRLLGIFLIWMVVFIGFGVYAIEQMNQLGSLTNKIYEHPLQASTLIEEANIIAKNHRETFSVLIVVTSILLFILFLMVIRGILGSITALKNVMKISTNTDQLLESDLEGNNEIANMAKHYNVLIKKLKTQFWIKNGKNTLNEILSGDIGLEELAQRAVQFLSRSIHAGKGVFYLYDEKTKNLTLKASFAFTKKEKFEQQYSLGSGIIGQVALEKEAILLTNIQDPSMRIETGTICQTPVNTYTFPLLYEEKLYGVIELAAFEPFDASKQEFLNEVGKIISANLYSTIQKENIKALLQRSEQQQQQLQQQTIELQESNAQLEEQQQMLCHQGAVLQESNAQLEEQQTQLEEQARLLEIKNQDLEKSKEELTAYSVKLETTNKFKSQFLANMSHELRTPLNSILLLSKLLSKSEQGELSEKSLEKVNIIYKAGNNLLRLINDILDLSKIESGKIILNNYGFHSRELVQEIEYTFDGAAKEKKIQFVVEDLVNQRLIGDKDKISQILNNLVSNAVKFTHKGSVIVKMMANEQKGVTFNVIDTGIGIPKDKLDIIFEEFQQVDGSISRKYGGTGLGLSICEKLADIMGGKINVSSEEGMGSNFSLFLPNVISQISDNNHLDDLSHNQLEAAYAEASSSREIDRISNANKCILIIEDDEDFSNVIRKINEDMGFDTVITKSAKEGLQLARNYKFDGILLDLGLPDMSGVEVLRELKSTRELRSIPVHILSVRDKDPSLREMGAIGYHQKPISEKEIMELLSSMIAFSEKRPKYLLVVEDDPVQRKAIKELIQSTEIEVLDVGTEKEAMDELKKNIYDAVILDLDLKEDSGMDSGMKICKFMESEGIEVPVIVYTGKDLTKEQETELKKYAVRILIKSTDSDEKLLDEVALFLHKVKINKKEDYLLPEMQKKHALSLEDKKILIVDDDPRNIFILAAALENYDAVIYEAENGKDAIEKLKQEKVDLILMDIMMPIMDGYEAMKAIRKDEELKDIPIIALTAKALKGDKEKCIESGANDYISKPVDYDALIQLVNAWIHK